MKAVLAILPSVVITMVLALACAPWGALDEARFVMPLLPYMAAHVFLARGVGVVPSPVLFVAGLVMDLATHGPLGFWAIIYLSGAIAGAAFLLVLWRFIRGPGPVDRVVAFDGLTTRLEVRF